jgi:hypothetical protein
VRLGVIAATVNSGRETHSEEEMVHPTKKPRRPANGREKNRKAWLDEVEEVVSQAEQWAAKRDWSTLRDEKTITEDIIGTYSVPRLLVHLPQGRLLLDPVARYVVAAEGRFDFCALPSFDSIPLVKIDGIWHLTARKKPGRRWSEELFEKTALELVKQQ